ncbi:MAG: peptidase M22, partial [Clostridiales bacterium]|nr:peptidase M22 [Clostridiales bacterium]
DTSNYTTSVALYDSEKNSIKQVKKLLPVKDGEIGLRQSDAVFHHTIQLPDLLEKLFEDNNDNISAVSVSSKPRWLESSYMPCFMTGVACARAISATNSVKYEEFSHQLGHIVAALYSADKIDYINREFIAFHISGGTTEVLLVKPDDEKVIKAEAILNSLDLKAGQAIDRVGVMLGLSFPAGARLDELSQKSEKEYKIKVKLKDGCCSLSGIENQCRKMFDNGEAKEDIAKFCICSIYSNINAMCEYLDEHYNGLPIVFAGGVMSNSYIRNKITESFDVCFAKPEFSSDNASGIAILGYLNEQKNKN